MSTRHRQGFTLVEMLVALVVAGLLMATLVGISGSVHRSFGRSKDITELQANLRFAMKTLVEDFTRAAFMASADPAQDTCHRPASQVCEFPGVELNALGYDSGTGIFTMRGNFVSSRDYLLNLNDNTIACRNKDVYSANPEGKFCGGYEKYLEPFADGPGRIGNVFCQNQWVRLDAEGDNRYCYLQVQSVDQDNLQVAFQGALNRNEIRGDHRWISPITEVRYQVVPDLTYKSRYNNTIESQRWVLQRSWSGCSNGQLAMAAPIEVAEFLLPPVTAGAAVPGFEVETILDDSPQAQLCAPEWQPQIQAPSALGEHLDPVRVRALVITLRGRTDDEDPAFKITDYLTDPNAKEFGVDLDGDHRNGLAYVRLEHTVIELRNLGLNLGI